MKEGIKMMKKIISLLLVFVLTFTVVPTATFAASANTRGNTVGNLHNDGYAAIQGDWIYYTNNDNWIPGIFSTDFYKMRTDGTKVTKLDQGLTISSEINIAGDWIYYRGWGGYLYKAKPDDSAATRLTDYSVEHIQVVDDWIYFSKRDIGGCAEHNLYRIRIDGTDEQMLADSEDDKRMFVNIAGDWIYYSNASDGFKLYKIRIDGTEKTKLNDEWSWYVNVVGDWIYYSDWDNGRNLYKIRTDGTNKTRLNSVESGWINVAGEWIYYIVPAGNGGSYGNLYRMRTDGKEVSLITESAGTFSVVGDWIYYYGIVDGKDGQHWIRLSETTFSVPQPQELQTLEHEDNNDAVPDKVNTLYKDDSNKIQSILTYPLDWLVTNRSSTRYDPELAKLAIAFSCAAYDNDLDCILGSFENHGFRWSDVKPYYGQVKWSFNEPAFALARKTDGKGNTVVAVVIRGSNRLEDWITDFTVGTDDTHKGFKLSAESVYASLRGFLGGIPNDENTKYFITGHSFGAAVANLLTVKLMSAGVQKSNVFTYTFATPNVAKKQGQSAWNPDGRYDNIINICNTADIVTELPPTVKMSDMENDIWWGKYGSIDWFTAIPDSKKISAPHNKYLYLSHIAPEATGDFGDVSSIRNKTSEFTNFNAAGILCPVDIDILNSSGVLRARFIDNQPQYLNGGENELILYTVDDEKYILSPAWNSYYHNIRASGSGTMDYIIRDYSPLVIGNSVIKSFENVSLTIGKQMTANIGDTIKPLEVQFYITDENGKNIGSIEGKTTVLDRYDASDWARNGIKEAIEKGFVPADLQNNYKNVITRQEFCRMAVKWVEYKTGKSIETVMQEKGVSRDPNAFTDTNDPDILAANALGITKGTGNNRFTPNGQFNREQAATMIRNTCKVAGMDISNVSSAGFADIGTASDWAVDGINFVRNAGIMQGTGNNKFDPKSTYTREQSILTFNNISFISEADLEAFANEVFLLTNIEREKAGLAVFRQSTSLTRTAKIRANELTSLFSHDRPDGRDCFTAFDENGVDYFAAGENIAMGQRSPKQVVDGWMNSPGHRANILDSGYGHLGVGVAADENGTYYWVQNFTD
jgi:uncharacterized protein YkwD